MQYQHQLILKKIFKYTVIAITVVIAVCALFFLLVYSGAFGSLPGKAELSAIRNAEASLVYSSDNILIGEYFAQNRTNIHSKDVPDHLKNALIATEDKRFFIHKGYDLQSYIRVFLKIFYYATVAVEEEVH